MSQIAGRPPCVIRCADIDSNKLELAKRFRQTPTIAEARAWELLRGRRLLGLKFRRQQVIAGFVVDFYCASLRLVLELDGGVHDDRDRRERDQTRTQVFKRRSLRVLRISNDDVHEQGLRDLLAPYARPQRLP
jgi:very-short-patch-repair endonuclease